MCVYRCQRQGKQIALSPPPAHSCEVIYCIHYIYDRSSSLDVVLRIHDKEIAIRPTENRYFQENRSAKLITGQVREVLQEANICTGPRSLN